MPKPYMATSLPEHQVAELHRLMNEEIKDVAVFFIDPDGFITVWSRGAEEMKGFTAQDTIGSHLSMLYTDEQKTKNWAEHNLGEAKKYGFYKEETWRQRKDGSLFWARIALTALRDHSGTLVGFSKVTMDLTDHKLLESCVKERQDTQRILRTANAGMWTWRPDTGQIEVCANFMGLLGHHDAPAAMMLAQWLGFVDPQDRDRVAGKFARAEAGGSGTPLVVEARMCKKDGSCRWFFMHADWSREKPGEPLILSGVNIDIHALKTTGEGLRQFIIRRQRSIQRLPRDIAAAIGIDRHKLSDWRINRDSQMRIVDPGEIHGGVKPRGHALVAVALD